MSSTAKIKNINFLNKSQFDSANISNDQLWLVERFTTGSNYKFGFYIDETVSDPELRVGYPEDCDNYHYAPAYMDFDYNVFRWGSWQNAAFLPKPCMLGQDGIVKYYLNPNNYKQKLDGTSSDVTNSNYAGNAMLEWSPVYVYMYMSGSRIYCYLSNNKLNTNYECWSAKKSDGSYAEHFYTSIYEGTVINNVLRSLSTGAKPTNNTNATNEISCAKANGSGWNIETYSDWVLFQLLSILMFKSTNMQNRMGAGATASTSGLTVNCGSCDSMGQFYGTSGRTSYGVKMFGREQPYGHRWDRKVGLLLNSGIFYLKMTKSTIDGSTTSDYNTTASGYINTNAQCPSMSQSYIKRMNPLLLNYGLLPSIVGASESTYYCDGGWSNLSDVKMAIFGASVHNGTFAGTFALVVDDAPSHSGWDLGASLSYKNF